MKEFEFLNIINKTISNNRYLGDDCAYLKDLGIYVTQDTLVENVHFMTKYTTPFDLGYKSVMVNLSDLASSFAKPEYIFISLSLPKNIKSDFIEDFYKGVENVCKQFNVVVSGGDLTGSDKIVVSICAIGKKIFNFDISRKFAKTGDIIVTTGVHGSSAAGLKLLLDNKNSPENFIIKHLKPVAQIEKALELGKFISDNSKIASMDTSDGLVDALYKIADNSRVSVKLNFNKIPYDKELLNFDDYQNLILYGGEDYELIFCLPEKIFEKLDKSRFFEIGKIENYNEKYMINIDDKIFINKENFEKNTFNHFEEN